MLMYIFLTSSHSDFNSPSKGADVFYIIETDHPFGCTATEGQNRNSSRSNRGSLAPPNFDTSTFVFQNENLISSLLVFPNPASDDFFLQIESQTQAIGDVRIYNLQGVELKQKTLSLNQGRNTLQIENDLPRGLVLIKLTVNGEVNTARLFNQSSG